VDKTDIFMSMLLLANSRLSYRQLSDRLGLSINAIHKRLQALIEMGVIRSFTAKASLPVGAIVVEVFGSSEAESVQALPEKLRKHGSIYWVALAGGNYVYVGAYLTRILELENFVDYVKKEAKIPDPKVAIVATDSAQGSPASQESKLYPLDYEIINALHDNSRKAISDVAEELGVSAKTARRRLSNMVKNGLIELSMKWFPDASNDIITIFHVRIKPTADKNEVNRVFKKLSPNVLFYWSFSNLPNELMCVVWTNTMKELKEIQERFEQEETFESFVPNILYVGYIFDTWRDRLPISQKS
jgi:DNA-binding Lrp family transcriptional regulator